MQHLGALRFAHRLYHCALCGYQNKHTLFQDALRTGFYNRDSVFTARYGLDL